MMVAANQQGENAVCDVMRVLGLGMKGEPLTEKTRKIAEDLEREERPGREAEQKTRHAEDRRRRLWPLGIALRAAHEMDYPEGWRLAMRELAEVALESAHPECEAAHLLLMAKISPSKLPVEAARALVIPISAERALLGADENIAFEFSTSPSLEELKLTWHEVKRRAAECTPGSEQ